ncbi:hypothetical protein [Thalassospira tepidiphila]|jgi:hypothetical protein|uniref:hypothetical protein n=1 Tax=Thalassospira tepidiphila TaxID=393657 RepID=UPI0029202E6D|nr:hypothetical protein MACH01_24710 [Thalassospira tepidiphila]
MNTPLKQLILIETGLLALFVLLGNGMRSVATMTVSVSQGEFASFLNISVERTDILIEVLIGGAVMALAIAPFLINSHTARKVCLATAILASASYAAVGLTMHWDPALSVREIIVLASFCMGGFAISFFAPLAQLAISQAKTDREKSMLTTVWTAAQPMAFLIAPQLVKYVAFDVGTGNYFLILAVMPLLFLLIMPMVMGTADGAAAPTATGDTGTKQAPNWKLIGLFLSVVIIFEAWTTANSFLGVESLTGLGLMSAFLVLSAVLYFSVKSAVPHDTKLPSDAIFLLVVLFILEIPTTGVYDTAYLVRHLCSSELIDDRATLGAASQVIMVFAAGALIARNPVWRERLWLLAIPCLIVASVATIFYPYPATDAALFYWTKMLSSIGIGIATTIVVSAVIASANGNKLITLAPAFVIMFGTEVGIEILEITFQISKLAGLGVTPAYQMVFVVQVSAVLLATTLMVWRWLAPKTQKTSAA